MRAGKQARLHFWRCHSPRGISLPHIRKHVYHACILYYRRFFTAKLSSEKFPTFFPFCVRSHATLPLVPLLIAISIVLLNYDGQVSVRPDFLTMYDSRPITAQKKSQGTNFPRRSTFIDHLQFLYRRRAGKYRVLVRLTLRRGNRGEAKAWNCNRNRNDNSFCVRKKIASDRLKL